MEIGVSDDRLHELFLGARAVYNGPFDEDYGYVTIEGIAAERPVVTLTRRGRAARVRDRTGVTGLRRRARPRRRSRRASIGSSRDADGSPSGWAEAGNALVREVVPTWPQIVARLLD